MCAACACCWLCRCCWRRMCTHVGKISFPRKPTPTQIDCVNKRFRAQPPLAPSAHPAYNMQYKEHHTRVSSEQPPPPPHHTARQCKKTPRRLDDEWLSHIGFPFDMIMFARSACVYVCVVCTRKCIQSAFRRRRRPRRVYMILGDRVTAGWYNRRPAFPGTPYCKLNAAFFPAVS